MLKKTILATLIGSTLLASGASFADPYYRQDHGHGYGYGHREVVVQRVYQPARPVVVQRYYQPRPVIVERNHQCHGGDDRCGDQRDREPEPSGMCPERIPGNLASLVRRMIRGDQESGRPVRSGRPAKSSTAIVVPCRGRERRRARAFAARHDRTLPPR